MPQFITYLGGSSTSSSGLELTDLETTEPLTYYVAAGGSDASLGTSTAPFLTIQKAINQLPKRIKHPVIINVGVGNFAGANIFGFIFEPGGYLVILGTLMMIVGPAGLMTGTVASATAGSDTSGTWSTMTVTGAGWTVNELRGKHVRITVGTGAGQIRPIASNTATVLTLPGAWTAPTGATFEIVDFGTNTNAASATWPEDYQGSGISGSGTFRIACNTGSGENGNEFSTIFLDQLKLSTGTTLKHSSPDMITVMRCLIPGVVALQGPGFLRLEDNSFSPAANTFPVTGTSEGGRLIATRNTFIFATSTGVAFDLNKTGVFSSVGMGLETTSNYIFQGSKGISVGIVSYVTSRGDKFDGNSVSGAQVAIDISSVTATPTPAMCMIEISSADISRWGIGVRSIGPCLIRLFNTVIGTANTTGIDVSKGTNIQISSNTTLTGTTEISIDGSAQTLAIMRAQVPKVLQDSNYGTKVYE